MRVRGDEQQPPGDPRQFGERGARLLGAAAGQLEVPLGRLRRPRIPEPARARRPRQRVAHGGEEGLRRAALPLEGECGKLKASYNRFASITIDWFVAD